MNRLTWKSRTERPYCRAKKAGIGTLPMSSAKEWHIPPDSIVSGGCTPSTLGRLHPCYHPSLLSVSASPRHLSSTRRRGRVGDGIGGRWPRKSQTLATGSEVDRGV